MDEVINIKATLDDQVTSKLSAIKTMMGLAFGAFSVQMLANWITKFRVMVDKVTAYQDKINDLSKSTGIATTTLSSLGYAAEQSGTSLDAVVVGLKNLMRNANAANSGVKSFKKVFEDLDIQVQDSNGNLKDGNTLLLDVARAFEKETNATEKAALAQKLFGRSGLALIPLLNEGAKGIERLQARAKKLGIVIGKDAAEDADKYRDNLNDLNKAFQGLETTFVTQIIPSLTQVTEKFTSFLIKMEEFRDSKVMQDIRAKLESLFPSWFNHPIQLPITNKPPKKTEGTEVEPPIPPIEKANKHLKEKIKLSKEWRDFNKQLEREIKGKTEEGMGEDFWGEGGSPEDQLKKQQDLSDRLIEIKKDEANKLKEIEEQKTRDQQEAFALLFDSLRTWGEESKTAFELYKAYALAETMISAAKSAAHIFDAVASQAWLGPLALPAAFAASGIAMAAGIAKAEMIASQKYEGRAMGGDVQAGMPYMIGERGREAFIPNMDGYVLPNSMLKKLGGKTVVINVNAIDTQSFRDFLRRGGSSVLENEMAKGKLF